MKKIFVLTLLIFVFAFTASAYDKVVFSKDSYDAVLGTSAEVAAVSRDGFCGVVDFEGNVIVPFEYISASAPDRNGNTVLHKETSDGIEAFIFDKDGNVIFSLQGLQITSYTEGVVSAVSDPFYNEDGILCYTLSHYFCDGKKGANGANASGAVVPCSTLKSVVYHTAVNEGHFAVTMTGGTLIFGVSEKEVELVYQDAAPLLPESVCSEGKIFFSGLLQGDENSRYVVDVKKKQRVNLTPRFEESESTFEQVNANIEGYLSFAPIINEDGNPLYSENGKTFAKIEDVYTYSIMNYIQTDDYKMGERIAEIGDIYKGEKYIFVNDIDKNYYIDKNGKAVDFHDEAMTTFSNGIAIAFNDDDGLYFINEKFERISECFTDVYAVGVSGKAFWAYNGEKYNILTLQKAASPAPDVSDGVFPKDESGMENFVKINTYNDTVFPDVNASHWYRENVILAYETGLMYGKENGFDASSNITVAQVITMAARIHSVYYTGKAEFEQGTVWYQVYVDYCVANGIIKKGEFSNYNKDATRAEFVRILSKAVPAAEFEAKNAVSKVPDVAEGHGDSDAILMFYKAGILAGSDSAHNFFPSRSITRAETAAIVTRIIDKTLRLKF